MVHLNSVHIMNASSYSLLSISECINDVYDAGLKNDKLSLIHKSNMSANIAIKTASGTSERFTI